MRSPVSTVKVVRFEGTHRSEADDLLVTEEPLEIRLGFGALDAREEMRLSVTMRTPGQDDELALGFLLTEGVVPDGAAVLRVAACENVRAEERGNVVRVELAPTVVVERTRWQRNFYASSSCGVCGKSSLEAVHALCRKPLSPVKPPTAAVLSTLPERMKAAQTVFKHTGGIHAAALFDASGRMLLLREDVGRHNAVDKLVGALTRSGIDPSDKILLVSGRAGFELVQKCVMAGIPVMAAVGAPTSLAVELAASSHLVLIGFLRGDRANIYA